MIVQCKEEDVEKNGYWQTRRHADSHATQWPSPVHCTGLGKNSNDWKFSVLSSLEIENWIDREPKDDMLVCGGDDYSNGVRGLLNRGMERWTAEPAKVRNYTKVRNKGILRNGSILHRSTRRSIGMAIRGAFIIVSVFFVCMYVSLFSVLFF